MPSAIASSVGIVAYLALFVAVGFLFLAVNLLVGRFVRPDNPTREKRETYECGEPAIGSSFVQFDLRFYVVALLFIIFDVEVAFFFPWATVFGKALHLAEASFEPVTTDPQGQVVLTEPARQLYRELGVAGARAATEVPASLRGRVSADAAPQAVAQQVIRRGARDLAWLTVVDILVFFAVLMVGFAYVWRRGDLDWVRAMSRERAARGLRGTPAGAGRQMLPA